MTRFVNSHPSQGAGIPTRGHIRLARGRNIVRTLVLGLLLVWAGPAMSQSTERGEVHGIVTDPSGAALPAARVVLTNLDTEVERVSHTGSTGVYVFPLVSPGFYSIKVEKDGFQTGIVERFEVAIQARVPIDLALQVGQKAEEILVRADAELLNKREASVSALINRTELADLPVTERQWANLVRLEPGVVPATLVTGSSFGRDFGNTGYIHGKRLWDNIPTIDGGQFYDPWIPYTTMSALVNGPTVSQEAVSEMRVYGNNPPPSEGFTYGGRINVITKSGGNSLHGSLYHFLRNDVFDAREFFAVDKPPLRRNLFGATIGGPIVKDKSFFFGNYEGMRQSLRLARVPIVPAPALMQLIPGGPANGFLNEILEISYPDPRPGTFSPGDLTAPFPTTADSGVDYDLFLVRIDHSIGGKHYLNFRYFFDEAETALGAIFSTGVPSTDLGAANRWQQLATNWTAVFSGTLQNEFRFSISRQNTAFPSRDTPPELVDCCGFASSITDPGSLPTILPIGTGLATVGVFPLSPQFRGITNFQLSDMVAWTKGTHSLKFGIDVITHNVNDFFPQDIRPFTLFVGFGDGVVDNSPNGIATGVYLLQTQTVPVSPPTLMRGIRRRQFAAYVQDVWQVTANLTLDLGVRYELVGRPFEVDDLMNNLYAADSSGNPIPDKPIGNISNVVLHQAGNCADCLPLHRSHNAYFAPRLGLAWSPFEKTVVRVGGGIQFGEMFFHILSFDRGNPPFSRGVVSFNQPFGTDILSMPAITPPAFGYDPAMDRPYYLEWNVSLQQEVIDPNTYIQVSYVANRGKKLIRPLTPNFGAAFAGMRPNPNFARIALWSGAANAWYDSLQVQLNRRLAKGLGGQISYTWAKCLDEASGEIFGFGDFNFPSDPSNPRADKGRCDYDLQHVLVGNFLHELPIGRGRPFLSNLDPWANAILGDWDISGILFLHSGQGLTFFSGLDNNLDGNVNDRARLLVSQFSSLTNTASLPPTQFFNPAGVGTEISATVGSILGRNTHNGPSFQNFDLAITKMFRWRERYALQFRTEFFNLFNHTNFGQPITDVSAPSFGLITETRNSSRQLQFSLKFTF